MVVTSHFVDNDWILQNQTLRYNSFMFLRFFVYLFGVLLMLECLIIRMSSLMLIYNYLYTNCGGPLICF